MTGEQLRCQSFSQLANISDTPILQYSPIHSLLFPLRETSVSNMTTYEPGQPSFPMSTPLSQATGSVPLVTPTSEGKPSTSVNFGTLPPPPPPQNSRGGYNLHVSLLLGGSNPFVSSQPLVMGQPSISGQHLVTENILVYGQLSARGKSLAGGPSLTGGNNLVNSHTMSGGYASHPSYSMVGSPLPTMGQPTWTHHTGEPSIWTNPHGGTSFQDIIIQPLDKTIRDLFFLEYPTLETRIPHGGTIMSHQLDLQPAGRPHHLHHLLVHHHHHPILEEVDPRLMTASHPTLEELYPHLSAEDHLTPEGEDPHLMAEDHTTSEGEDPHLPTEDQLTS
jgi:hypothetical protein